MNRRSFLTRVCTGIVGAAVVTKLPVEWLPNVIKKPAALEYLRYHYNAYCEARAAQKMLEPHVPCDDRPSGMVVRRWLFEQAEVEMPAITRFTSPKATALGLPNIQFKGVPLLHNDAFVSDPRGVVLLNKDELARYVGQFSTTSPL